ncbi:sensor histidine kinase [Cohnella fermenti]|nr:histidine kinase [Cohnella fermenti]
MFVFIKNWSFGIWPKLVLIFLLGILPLYGLSLAMSHSGTSTVQSSITKSVGASLQYYLSSFEAEMQKISDLKQAYIADDDFQKLSDLAPSMSPFEQTQSILRIQDRLDLLKTSSLYVDEVKVYFPMLHRTISTDNYYGVMEESEISALVLAQNNHWTLFHSQDKLLMAQVYPEPAQPSFEVGFALEIELSIPKIREQLNRTLLSGSGGAMLVDRNGNWGVIGGDGERLAESFDDFLKRPEFQGVDSAQGTVQDASGESYLVTFRWSELLDAVVVIGVPKHEVLGPLEKYRLWYRYQLLLTIAVILFCSYWIFRLIHRPLRKLLSALRQVERGQLDVQISDRSRDEFKYLYLQFNQMTDRIRYLIQEVYEQQLRSQRSELKQLQSQINPHFLYNSFFILRRMAQIPDIESVKRMTIYLGEYFRFMTRTGRDEVELGQEVGHSRTYANIQSMRFGSKIEVQFEDLPGEYADLKVPRLIIQPILENAYQHALEDRIGQGRLRISYRIEPERLSILVEDNGESLEEEVLDRLRRDMRHADHNEEVTGLLNVNRRLKLKFGEEGGMELSRSPDFGGLLVTLNIPLEWGK